MKDLNEKIGNEIADAYNTGFEDGEKHGRKLIELVENWAEEKDLLHEENADKQFLKFIEEVFEFRDEYTKLKLKKGWLEESYDKAIKDGVETLIDLQKRDAELEMGDIFVTLIILCKQLQMNPLQCLEMAYEKIKGRKGKTIGGTFIKEEDLHD